MCTEKENEVGLDSETVKKRNRELCKRFPFLIPRNRWTGRKITDGEGFWVDSNEVPEYDYEFTELDEMPDGWRKAFGEQMCQEIMDELVSHNAQDECYPVQIKEKYAELRVYFNQYTENLEDIIDKYSDLSTRTCICCGKPATKISKGWISPYCDDCSKRIRASQFWTIEEYLHGEN